MMTQIQMRRIQKLFPNTLHFDTDSVHTKSSGSTMRVKKKEYKYAESSKTKEWKTQSGYDPINKHFSKKTTLLLLAAKTKSWGIVKAILELDPAKYPSLFQDPDPKTMEEHPLYHRDESKANCMYLAIEDGEIDICEMIIDRVDVRTLKSSIVCYKKDQATNKIKDQNTLKILEEKISEGQSDFEYVKSIFEEKCGKKKEKVTKNRSTLGVMKPT